MFYLRLVFSLMTCAFLCFVRICLTYGDGLTVAQDWEFGGLGNDLLFLGFIFIYCLVVGPNDQPSTGECTKIEINTGTSRDASSSGDYFNDDDFKNRPRAAG